MGNLDLAIMDFTKAIELDPRMSSSFYGRSVIERKRGDEVRALARGGHIWPR